MSPGQFIKKIKNFSTISFILPLVTINFCMLVFKFMGSVDLFPNYNLNNETFEHSYIESKLISNDKESYTFTNCSKYRYDVYFISNNNEVLTGSEHGEYITSLINENKIKSVRLVPGKIIDDHCIKNYPFAFSLFDK